MNAAIDAIVSFLKAANAILSTIPALVWAVVLGFVFLWGSYMHHERDAAVSQLNVVQAAYEQLTAKVIHQKNEARALYVRLLAERDALQKRLNEDRAQQEKKDANAQKVIDDQAARLRALAPAAAGGQLRDPNGAGCGRGGRGPESAAAAPVGSGADDKAEAGGLLSAQLSRLLRELTGEADAINRAYASCRNDALSIRGEQPEPVE